MDANFATIQLEDYRRGRIALAVRKGDLKTVKQLIAEGCDPDEADYNGRIPLLDAVSRQDLAMVRLLLKSGCSVMSTNGQGETALHLAVETTPLVPEVIYALLESGADPNIHEKLTGNTVLHTLVKHDGYRGYEGRRLTLQVLGRLIAHSDVNARSMHGNSTALHRAISATSDDDVVADRIVLLLEAGASADVQDDFGETPLHLAVRGRLGRTVECLIAVGTDVNLVDRYMQTALHFAASKGFYEIVGVLVERPSCDLNLVDLNGETALHLAAGKGHAAVVRLLLNTARRRSHIIDRIINVVDNRGMIPLHKAIESGFVDVVQELLVSDCMSDLLLTSTSKWTSVDLAFRGAGACRATPEITQLLLTAMETVIDQCGGGGGGGGGGGTNETPI